MSAFFSIGAPGWGVIMLALALAAAVAVDRYLSNREEAGESEEAGEQSDQGDEQL